jgi:anti-sigma factor RsiW
VQLDQEQRMTVRFLMVQCTDVASRLTEYQEAALPEDEQRQVEEHLRSCAACARLCEELRQTTALLRQSADTTSAPQHLKETLRSAFKTQNP